MNKGRERKKRARRRVVVALRELSRVAEVRAERGMRDRWTPIERPVNRSDVPRENMKSQ